MKTQVISSENLILIDWLTFTTKIFSENDLISMLHLGDVAWEHKDAYRYGYSHRCSFGGITILSGGHSEDMGICVDISGQGCRCFEDYSSLSWLDLFQILTCEFNEFNITRLDLAYDDHTGILDIGTLLDYTDHGWYRSKSRYWLVEYGSTGTCIYHGSVKSDIRFRIYDKAAERGLLDGTHWIRVEQQLRGDRSKLAVSHIVERRSVGSVFTSILQDYLVYVEPSETDSNKSRWAVCSFWSELLSGASDITLTADPGMEYNIWRLRSTILEQYSGAIYTWIQIHGIDDLVDLIKERRSPLNPKHKMLLQQYQKLKSEGGSCEENF